MKSPTLNWYQWLWVVGRNVNLKLGIQEGRPERFSQNDSLTNTFQSADNQKLHFLCTCKTEHLVKRWCHSLLHVQGAETTTTAICLFIYIWWARFGPITRLQLNLASLHRVTGFHSRLPRSNRMNQISLFFWESQNLSDYMSSHNFSGHIIIFKNISHNATNYNFIHI